MVGNDIVDLKQAAVESHWQRKGFLHKVFTPEEISYIRNSDDKSRMVWRLWSMKESAYKINVQQYNRRFFNPKKIACTFLDALHGVVKIDHDDYHTLSTINRFFIYTVAVSQKTDKIQNDCFEIDTATYNTQSKTSHSKLKAAISQRLHIKNEHISVKKSIFGIPRLYKNENLLDIDCSLTHHGNYGAYAYFAGHGIQEITKIRYC